MFALNLLVLIASASVAAVCVALVLHREYEDGLIGRISLACMGVAALARAASLLSGLGYVWVSPVGVLLWCGLAAFMVRHVYRFARWRRCGENDWRPSKRQDLAGKGGRT